ncbi:hypothetical protein [Parasedimentitalea psychrophila]|uniref:Uncharacterized protein n=1 Tax=Parasedimentitalea psychrophila TaxID=2997337 RepID=A0A9Y2P0Q0_9RHOB|nr:hypothetical protein [Parasedimentitalea psychrophila]WIY23372.1 hypothetical protein QPJ95_11915 [Parasedimentitalea psychrophila]
MAMTVGDHYIVVSSLERLSCEDLDNLKFEFEDMFAETEIQKASGSELGYTKKEIEVSIEGYVRIDSKLKGKGWWYRSKLRSKLTMKLL